MKLFYIKSESDNEIDEVLIFESDKTTEEEVLGALDDVVLAVISEPYVAQVVELLDIDIDEHPAFGRSFIG